MIACAAYTLGPLAKHAQDKMLRTVEETGGYSAEVILDSMQAKIRWRWAGRCLLRWQCSLPGAS